MPHRLADVRLFLLMALLMLVSSTAEGQELAKRLRALVRKEAFSGTVLVERKGAVILHEGFGIANRAFGVRASSDTRYKIASITKAFTSVLVLQLVDEGKVDLEAPIRAYLPDYQGEGAGRVTVHQLLNHTSGIENFDRVTTFEEAVTKGIPSYQLPHTSAELLRDYASGKLAHEPGESFDYNNADYVILGRLVEHATGLSWEEALKQRILTPLGMANTGVLYQRDVVPRLAATYLKVAEGQPFINDLPVYPENWYAAGAMYSTTGDLRRFAQALFGGRLLKPETLKSMLTPGLDEYGYGIWIRDVRTGGRTRRVAQRPGQIMGANTVLLRYLDDDVTIIVLGNTSATNVDALAYALAGEILK